MMQIVAHASSLAGFIAWACSTAAQAFTIQEVKSPGGITAWLVEEKAIPLLAMNFSFKSGSADDPAGKEGVSQFLTGMMDEGAGDMLSQEFQKKRDELAFRMSFDADADFFEGCFQTLTRNRKRVLRSAEARHHLAALRPGTAGAGAPAVPAERQGQGAGPAEHCLARLDECGPAGRPLCAPERWHRGHTGRHDG